MSARDTSLRAYHELEDSGLLQDQERELMRVIWLHFPWPTKFTRKELKNVSRWEINVIAGRTNGLVKKKFLTEFPETRDGGHLLQINQGTTTVSKPTDAVLIHSLDAKGKPFSYWCEGWGPGHPPDCDAEYSRWRR